MNFIRKCLHWLGVLIIGIIIIWTQLNNQYWTNHKILVWDVYGYSQYLSSYFVYHDIGNSKELCEIDSIYRPTNGSHYYGRHCCREDCKTFAFKYTMGNAVMISPFYLTAHFITKSSKNFPADGYSELYQLAVVLFPGFWAICGMVVLTLLLGRWFNPVVISVSFILIVLGTNYFYYASLECGMTHVPGFFCMGSALFTMFLWFVKKLWWYAFLFGVSTGMIV